MPSPEAIWHRWPHGPEVDAGLVEFGRELREARRRAGLTQLQLERRSGIDQTMISRLECGRTSGVPLRRLLLLAAGFDAVLGFQFRSRPRGDPDRTG